MIVSATLDLGAINLASEESDDFCRVIRELESQRAAGYHSNASVAAYLDGELVLDVDSPRRECGGPRPLFRAFSAGKPMAAAVIWRLIDAGRIELDAPVADYWPEFAQSGKSEVTVRHVMTHTSGLALDTTRSDIDWMDWGRVTDALAASEPQHAPGELIEYHAFTFGWLVAEIAGRVTGDPFEILFDREVRQPLGLHDTQYVISRDDTRNLDRVVRLRTGRDFDDKALPLKMDGLLLLEVSFPAGSCVTTARDLAKFYNAIVARPVVPEPPQLVGCPACDIRATRQFAEWEAPKEWLSQRTRELVYATHADTFDLDESRFVRFGLGVAFADHQPNRMAAPEGTHSFGHGGLGTCVGWGDPDHGLSVAILTDTAVPESVNYRRLNRISAAVRTDLCTPAGTTAEL